MTQRTSLFASTLHSAAFWAGCLAVTAGVLLHLPMFLMGRSMGYRLAGMPMDNGMLAGMGLIIIGCAATAYGLLPRRAGSARVEELSAPEDAPLTRTHWEQICLLAIALVIDVMKAASLGFVIPGMRAEYHLTRAAVSVLPFFALMGTTLGSFLWGWLADIYGRRASILLAAIVFMATSICGAMPSFTWNIIMCFLMGLGAGGMLPVAYALLAEIMPTRHRGWCLVLVGGVGTVGGYFATSACSAALQPVFGWRILWLINLPISAILVIVSPLLQESARFLQQMGRWDEARATLTRFGITQRVVEANAAPRTAADPKAASVVPRGNVGVTLALTLAALSYGFVNFGVLLWLPGTLVAEGRSMGVASALIARSSLVAIPTIVIATWLYSIWNTKRVLGLSIGVTVMGLIATMLRGNSALPFLKDPALPISLLIVGSSATISMLLPYAAESYSLRVRGRATGWTAGCSKAGGLIAQLLAMFALVPKLGTAAGVVAIPCAASMLLLLALGRDTRNLSLQELEAHTTSPDETVTVNN